MDKYGIRPNKRMGQNFLIDELVLREIISAAELSENDTILEIGPGLGILTFELAKKAKKVIAVEKDKELVRILNNELGIKNIENVEVIQADILKITDYRLLITDYKIIANLPYYITSPVIRKFLETENRPELMVLMVQKEVAERICALSGKMSILSVAVQFYAKPEIVSIVPKTSFYPRPKVDSAILRIKPRINTNLITNINEFDTEKFFKMVRAGFSSKRKFLINNLKKGFNVRGSKFEDVFNKTKIDIKSRAEELSVESWINVYEQIKNNL